MKTEQRQNHDKLASLEFGYLYLYIVAGILKNRELLSCLGSLPYKWSPMRLNNVYLQNNFLTGL